MKETVTVKAILEIEKGESKEFILENPKEIFTAKNTLYYTRSVYGEGKKFSSKSNMEKPSITIFVD